MKKENREDIRALARWCDCAAQYIKYGPERDRVYAELYSHMEDKYLDLVDAGLEPPDAEKLTVRAMGDYHEVGRALEKIHKPFWGYILRITWVVLMIVAIVAVHKVVTSNYVTIYGVRDEISILGTLYNLDEDDTLYYPDCKDSSDGYTFTVPVVRVTCWDVEATEYAEAHHAHMIHFTVRATSPYPWSDCPSMRRFTAVDNFGNVYTLRDLEKGNAYSICGNYFHTGLFSWDFCGWLEGSEFDEIAHDIEWFDLCYTEAGRDIRLHIDLRSGGAPYEEN